VTRQAGGLPYFSPSVPHAFASLPPASVVGVGRSIVYFLSLLTYHRSGRAFGRTSDPRSCCRVGLATGDRSGVQPAGTVRPLTAVYLR
jgi:hypothetical protein